ncbi:MAG: hypothetical protein ACSHX5_06805 [Phycisphaerales bacterium]
MLSTLPYQFGKTTVILGAGATVGTSLRTSTDRPRPPLDTDFFTQIQRLKNPKHVPYVDALLKFCHDEFGPGWSLGMEQFYNYVWYAQRFRPQNSLEFVIEGGSIALKMEELFKQVLLAVFEESLYGLHSQDPLKTTCELHDAIALQLEKEDSIISFNYDCVMDCSLVKHCPFWRVEDSYATKLLSNNQDYWRGDDLEEKGTVFLHKLHGSVNWKVDKNGLSLKRRPYTRQSGSTKYHIVPPIISKDLLVDDHLFSGLWKSAAKKLADSKTVVVVGYSIPSADALANAMLASRAHTATEENRELQTLVIANMDRDTRHRIIRTFRSSIGAQTKVLVFDTMLEMNEFLFRGESELN